MDEHINGIKFKNYDHWSFKLSLPGIQVNDGSIKLFFKILPQKGLRTDVSLNEIYFSDVVKHIYDVYYIGVCKSEDVATKDFAVNVPIEKKQFLASNASLVMYFLAGDGFRYEACFEFQKNKTVLSYTMRRKLCEEEMSRLEESLKKAEEQEQKKTNEDVISKQVGTTQSSKENRLKDYNDVQEIAKNKLLADKLNKEKEKAKQKEEKSIARKDQVILYHPVTNDPIVLTKEQQGCVNYVGDKRKDLVIRSAAGGGKTLVILGRALEYLQKAKSQNNWHSIAVFTYNHVLATVIKEWMRLTPEDEKYIFVGTLHEYLLSIYVKMPGLKLRYYAHPKAIENSIQDALEMYRDEYKTGKYLGWGAKFWAEEFIWMQNMNIFDESDRDIYLTMKREGRGHEHPMTESDRIAAYNMFIIYQGLKRKHKIYDSGPSGDERILYLTHNVEMIPDELKFDHILIDEAQDQSLAKMIALRSIARKDVTICMDANQRIYEGRWRFSQAGLEPTSRRLSYPFRCTSQIDALAESLKRWNLPEMAEEDKVEHKVPTVSGEKPEIITCSNEDEEKKYLIALIKKWMKEDPEHTIGVLCFENKTVEKMGIWLSAYHIPYELIRSDVETPFSIRKPGVKLCTMHSSKGLEFMRVILPQFYQGMIPQKWAMNDEEALMQERNTAYVAMTRAMHQLVILYNGNKSEFVKELDEDLYTARTFREAVKTSMLSPTPAYEKRTVPEEAKRTVPDQPEDKESKSKKWSF